MSIPTGEIAASSNSEFVLADGGRKRDTTGLNEDRSKRLKITTGSGLGALDWTVINSRLAEHYSQEKNEGRIVQDFSAFVPQESKDLVPLRKELSAIDLSEFNKFFSKKKEFSEESVKTALRLSAFYMKVNKKEKAEKFICTELLKGAATNSYVSLTLEQPESKITEDIQSHLIRLFYSNSIDINETNPDEDHQTELMRLHGSKRVLLKTYIELSGTNMRDKLGNTALHHAVAWRDVEKVATLVEAGSKLDRNNAGKTPVDLAQEKNYFGEDERALKEMRDLLEKK